jgi:hypothetical protein
MVSIKSDTFDLGLVQRILNPAQMALFIQMQPGEKEHAIVMVRKLTEQDENQPDLLVAALLHDVGKLRYHYNPLERTMVVLVKAVMPEQARQWGNPVPAEWENLPGWRKPFVVAEQHAAWGADIARQAGASALAETLIREHHHQNLNKNGTDENSLLYKLWVVDNES